jgi:hypothetical protein
MTEADGLLAVDDPRGPGRPLGRKNNTPSIEGWHSEQTAAQILGEDIQTRRRKRRAGLPPHDWARAGRHVLYRNGAEEQLLANELRERTAAAEPRRRRR